MTKVNKNSLGQTFYKTYCTDLKWMKENDVNGLELLKDIIQYYKDNDGKIEFPTIN